MTFNKDNIPYFNKVIHVNDCYLNMLRSPLKYRLPNICTIANFEFLNPDIRSELGFFKN